jgi:hypothetical protein
MSEGSPKLVAIVSVQGVVYQGDRGCLPCTFLERVRLLSGARQGMTSARWNFPFLSLGLLEVSHDVPDRAN